MAHGARSPLLSVQSGQQRRFDAHCRLSLAPGWARTEGRPTVTHLLCSRQTSDERVNPVLMANLSISMPLEVHPTATPDSLLERMFNKNEQEMKDRMASYIKTRPRLAMYLESRHEKIEDKQRRLREEYRGLQEKWLAHCNMLNEAQKTLASEHELQHTGRTTRRSTAFTDAVRSDFEMEQIIASLGVDDATDPNHLSTRNLAKIPDMISVTGGQVDYSSMIRPANSTTCRTRG